MSQLHRYVSCLMNRAKMLDSIFGTEGEQSLSRRQCYIMHGTNLLSLTVILFRRAYRADFRYSSESDNDPPICDG